MVTEAAPLIFVGVYRIPAGAADAWRDDARSMTAFVEANEPRIIGFHHYLDAETSQGTTIQIHPDGASLVDHLELAATRIAHGTATVEVIRIELFGAPDPGLIGRLRQMTRAPVTVNAHVSGFSRFR